MAAALAEHIDQQVRCTIDHQVLVGKAGRGGNKTGDADDLANALQVAVQCSLCLGKNV